MELALQNPALNHTLRFINIASLSDVIPSLLTRDQTLKLTTCLRNPSMYSSCNKQHHAGVEISIFTSKVK